LRFVLCEEHRFCQIFAHLSYSYLNPCVKEFKKKNTCVKKNESIKKRK
jgi:hypothetical protein